MVAGGCFSVVIHIFVGRAGDRAVISMPGPGGLSGGIHSRQWKGHAGTGGRDRGGRCGGLVVLSSETSGQRKGKDKHQCDQTKLLHNFPPVF